MEERLPETRENVPHASLSDIGRRPGCVHYFVAAVGSMIIGIAIPSLLVGLRLSRKGLFDEKPEYLLKNIGLLFVLGIAVCGPGAMLLSTLLLSKLSRPSVLRTQYKTMLTGAQGGIAIAFLNVPGYFIAIVLRNDTFVQLRVALLFVVSGCTCGLWVAWQAWRSSHPGERFLPRFTLQTLILLVILWGAVLVVFQPA